MAKTGCVSGSLCPYKAVWWVERVVVTGVVSALVLAKPLANAIGLTSDQNIGSAHLVFSITTLFVVAAWVGSIYVAYKDDVEHYWTVIVNAAGIPGFFLAAVFVLTR